MKAYSFRLATVARIRELEERVAGDRFKLALRDLRHAREREYAAADALAALQAPAGVTTMADLVWIGDQGERLFVALQECRQAASAAESMSVEARRAWDEAAKRSGVLERLNEQGLVRWRGEMAREEGAELDDLSHARFRSAGAARVSGAGR
jgi:flagellar export protein FliJ